MSHLHTAPLNRRVLLWLATLAAPAMSAGHAAGASTKPERFAQMKMACVIRYQIDPAKLADFREYAERWGEIIPRCGGHLLGYFLPWEGTNDIAWALIAFNSLAEYEIYRQRLKSDPDARANLAMAQVRRIIVREERNFVEIVDATFEKAASQARS